MTKVTNNGRSPLTVHPKKGTMVLTPGLSVDEEFTEGEIKAMKGHPDLEVGGKGKKGDDTTSGDGDGSGTPPPPPPAGTGLPGLGS